MSVASTLPAKTWPRSRERVRIVFSVPFWLSEATTSPATSDVISGKAQKRHEEERDERDGEPRVPDVAAERHVVRPARLELEHDHEDERHEHRRAQAEVRALLGQQLRDLPAVDGGHATSARDALLSPDSPPVSPRKSSSRLALSGTSAVMPMRAWPRAIEIDGGRLLVGLEPELGALDTDLLDTRLGRAER